MLKESEKLPNKIELSLEKGRVIIDNWKNSKLNSLINDCINIENNLNDLNKVNELIEKSNSLNIELNFESNEEELNKLLENIKNYGTICFPEIKFDSKINIDIELVKNWLNNRYFQAQLLFRKSRDGSKSEDFHKKCDNKGITITFIETTDNYIFGGYTELEWDKSFI